ncbi:IclR family transcriptional regulator [Virgibacillus alimentarius]|uniref:DNA-binding IclR family transcriptional regulator n=1 Tax=Virgibacillus alimentarius TaxID=698769 RepID=A0ABS4SBK7_9BACI|nr:IclR family transcriptional regulator [Virgibacillus alimentarius]MBP2258888.1 DNA-binding IclR family transcriptional regulator [Virgibacillus alimentarius]
MILKTLDNAIQVLNCFTKEKKAWGVRELARKLETSHTAINRILVTFEKNNFLTQDPETKKYHLGLKFVEFSEIVRGQFSITEAIEPIMQEISRKTRESIFLTWKENDVGVTLGMAESEERIKFSVSIGTRTPLYVGASCKVMMAYLSREEQLSIIDKGLRKFTENTPQNKEQLLKELDEIKEQGWSFTDGEYSDQVFGLGVPIFDTNGRIIASITIAGPEYRITEEKKIEMLELLLVEIKSIQQVFYNYI